jgi:phosphoglycerol transferase MdoB-like AlkP superfamily enzyme
VASNRLLVTLLLLSSALLLVPKAVLLEFSADVLSVRMCAGEILAALLQDLALAMLCWAALSRLLSRPGAWRWALGFFAMGALLSVLLIDCRARQMWLKPLDLEVARYGLASLDDLESGIDVFFRRAAGLGMTLRRWILLVGAAHFVLWAAVGLVLWRQRRRRGHGDADPRATKPTARGLAASALLAIALLCTSAALAPAMYGLQQNLFVAPLVNLLPLRSVETTKDACDLAREFEQPVRGSRELFHTPRHLAVDAAPFQNLVLIMFETWRWRGMHLDDMSATDPPAPFLRKLASEGILARSYVSLPHSSKSYYSVLTGRHPWPGIEMVESVQRRSESLFWELAERRDAATHCFSTMTLSFENLDDLLRSLGVACRKQLGEKPVNSFGHCDELLLETVPELAACTNPFAVVYLPLAAHYPYSYPGKPCLDEGIDAYLACVRHADAFLSRLIERLGAAGLWQNTLLVIVGDHGESFGEHGTVIHNNSMYEEEVTSPLIFWSADARLRTPGVRVARHIDITPTVLDLMGLHDCELPVQGRSLLRGDAPAVAWVTSFFDGVAQARIEGDDKVIYHPTTGHMLAFDLALDPNERRGTPVPEPARGRLRRQFEAHTTYQRSLFGR